MVGDPRDETDEENDEAAAAEPARFAEHPGAASAAGLGYNVARLDHVQVAMPPGLEAEAEAFYAAILGMKVVAKPPLMAARGGRWFEQGSVRVHLGAEEGFRPAHKAHPALVIEGLDGLVEALADAGYPVKWDYEQPGVRRCFVADPFGNRIELIEA